MSNQVQLFLQLPKPAKTPIVGTLCITGGEAFLFDWVISLAELKKPEVMFLNSDGLKLRGYEPNGVDKAGREKLIYQEWRCKFNE